MKAITGVLNLICKRNVGFLIIRERVSGKIWQRRIQKGWGVQIICSLFSSSVQKTGRAAAFQLLQNPHVAIKRPVIK